MGAKVIEPAAEIAVRRDKAAEKRREISKLVVVDRLIAADKLGVVLDIINADATVKARYDAAQVLNRDDTTLLAVLAAVSADAGVILA